MQLRVKDAIFRFSEISHDLFHYDDFFIKPRQRRLSFSRQLSYYDLNTIHQFSSILPVDKIASVSISELPLARASVVMNRECSIDYGCDR